MVGFKEFMRRGLVLFQFIIVLVFQTLVFVYIWYENFARTIPNPFWNYGNYLLFLIYAVLLYIAIKMYGGNRLGFVRTSDIIYTNSIAIILVNAIIFAQVSLIARYFVNWGPFIMMTSIQILFIITWSFISKTLYTHYFPPRKMLMIVGNPNSIDLKFKMDYRTNSFDIAETVYLSEGIDFVLKKTDEYKEIIISDVSSGERNMILKYCYRRSKRVFMTPKISDIIIRGSQNIHLFDTPLLLANNRGLRFEERVIKRFVDIIGSSVGILILSPLFLIVAILIKLTDNGPILYTQKRLTINGKQFDIYKFRSMRVDSEKDHIARLAMKDDERITPVGKWLRRLHIDELPQLLNIFIGDMSIVGPRPERPDIAAEYEKFIPEFTYRLKVKAGLSGYAQVYGQYNTTPYDKLKLDLFYIENYSIWKDFNIILLTIKIMFQNEKSEGVDASQITAMQSQKDLLD
jgi:exopolysaccharide biosynthesis polyprenyl glycosylphosphotransferase